MPLCIPVLWPHNKESPGAIPRVLFPSFCHSIASVVFTWIVLFIARRGEELDPGGGLRILRAQGIPAKPEDTQRDIAARHDLTPHEIRQTLQDWASSGMGLAGDPAPAAERTGPAP